ncbi:hypothetical protein Goklo_003542 [Gossypium klotzschianum]|uniref:DUF3700 domain-containing protein n=1 Tax=Gossypium klotzschianum TaxID=34286 RepID=A0A7J8VLD8_9ROSI|nr:hypothetical protein [Gossypium klotzschianum]
MLAVFEKATGNPPEELRLPSVGLDSDGKGTREEILQTFRLLWPESTFYHLSNGNFMTLSHGAQSPLHPRQATEAMLVVDAYKVLRDRAPYPPDQVIKDLEGKFAFIIFDAKSGTLFVARDREGSIQLKWGMAPWYYQMIQTP